MKCSPEEHTHNDSILMPAQTRAMLLCRLRRRQAVRERGQSQVWHVLQLDHFIQICTPTELKPFPVFH